jgi:hypothetical protein
MDGVINLPGTTGEGGHYFLSSTKCLPHLATFPTRKWALQNHPGHSPPHVKLSHQIYHWQQLLTQNQQYHLTGTFNHTSVTPNEWQRTPMFQDVCN